MPHPNLEIRDCDLEIPGMLVIANPGPLLYHFNRVRG
jgi:hypothetical protein